MQIIDPPTLAADLEAVITTEKKRIQTNRAFMVKTQRENERQQQELQTVRHKIVQEMISRVQIALDTILKSPDVRNLLTDYSTKRWRRLSELTSVKDKPSTLELARGQLSDSCNILLCIVLCDKIGGVYRLGSFTQTFDSTNRTGDHKWLWEINPAELYRLPETLDRNLREWANPSELVRAIVRALYEH